MRSTSALAAAIVCRQIARRLVTDATKILGRAQRGVERTARGVLEAHRHEQAVRGGGGQPQRKATGNGNVAARRHPSRTPLEERGLRRGDHRRDVPQHLDLLDQPVRAPIPPRERRTHMVEADSLKSRQHGTLDPRRPGKEIAPFMVLLQRTDDPSPERRGHVIGIQATEPADACLHQAREPIQPPHGHRLGDLGLLQPGIGDVQPMRCPPRAGRRATTARSEPVIRAAPNDGIDRDLIDGQIEPDAQPMFRGLPRHPCDAGIGGAGPAQRRVQRLVIAGDEDVAAGARHEGRRNAHRVEPHGTAAREMRRPIGQFPGNQRMQVVDLGCHAVVVPCA